MEGEQGQSKATKRMKDTRGGTHLNLNCFFVGANSPSLCPTISCVMTTGM